jgi:16S rRNA (guanine527-N7)-methyltransferase
MEFLEAGADALGLSLSSWQMDQFARYQSLLLLWNERFNLTAAHTAQEIQTRHFVDSLTCASVSGDLNGRSLIDVGSGAGFPGLPLKILFPELSLALLESVGKKGEFLKEVVSDLQLQNVAIIAERAEVLGHNEAYREHYDWAVARAVARLPTLLEYLLPFCRIGGQALAQKGERAGEEIEEAQNAILVLGGKLVESRTIESPGGSKSNLVVVQKINPTPAKYPRRVGIPRKRPL